MSIAAEAAIRSWVNAQKTIVGEGNLLSRGAYLVEQRSPADGAYAVISRQSEGVTYPVAEDSSVCTARMQCVVYAGTAQAAELAADALLKQIERLTGCPERCGDAGVKVLVTDNRIGPFQIPAAADSGEIYAFQVNADFVLTTDT